MINMWKYDNAYGCGQSTLVLGVDICLPNDLLHSPNQLVSLNAIFELEACGQLV
jgi:hypothetical protein